MTLARVEQPAERLSRSAGLGVALVGGVVVSGALLSQPSAVRSVIAGAVATMLIGLAFVAPRTTLYLLLAWLGALGFVRRLVSEVVPAGNADPLILVGPLALVALVIVAWGQGAFNKRTVLSNAVLVFTGLLLLGALNPLQGGLVAGLAGLIFVLVPTLAFWVGRALCDDGTLKRVLTLVGVFGVLAAAYGLAQTFVGFPSWDAGWIEARRFDYLALDVNGVIRPFASFASAAEYAYVLAIGFIATVALGLRGRWGPIGALSGTLTAVALLFASARGVLVALIAALALMGAARRRLPVLVGVAASVALLATLPLVAGRLAPSPAGASPASALLAHQTTGLANPLDPEASTLRLHATLIRGGIESAFSEPLGHGVSAVTIAGAKFGELAQGTEADPSNVAVGLGLPGLLAFVIIAVAGLYQAYAVATRRRDALGLVALGILVLTFLQWLNGGLYLVAPLVWLLFGWLDRQRESSM